MRSQTRIFDRLCRNVPPGKLEWIGLRPKKKAEILVVNQVKALEELGLEGDHRVEKTPGSARQVTIISHEFIGQIAHFLKRDSICPSQLRRNLVVSNINLNVLRHQQFTIGEAIFEATALCHPCARMESALGKGALAAMLGHGGICAKIIKTGMISLGDCVTKIDGPEQDELF